MRIRSSGSRLWDVQKDVQEQTGMRVEWDRTQKAQRENKEAIGTLLRSDLTVNSAVQIALLNNRSLQASYEELGIAQAEFVEAGLPRNPTVSVEARFPKYHVIPLEFDVTQSFLDLLFLPQRKRAAGAAFEATKHRVVAEVLNTAAHTSRAFYQVQGAGQLVEMRRGITRAAEASFEAARALREAGNVTALVLANQQALYEQSKLELAKAEAQELDAREELTAQLGLWGADIPWTIEPRLPMLPADAFSAPALEALGITRRPDLAAARQDVEAAAQRLGLSSFSALGDVNVGGHYERDADGTTTIGPAISFPLPIFNQGQPAIAAAQARFRQSQRRYEALGVEIRSQIRRARNQMSAARDRAERLGRVVVPLRHQIVQQEQLQFNAMQVGVFELLQARQGEIDAGREYVEALQEYWIARAELERTIGGRLPAASATTQATQPTTTQESHHHHHGE